MNWYKIAQYGINRENKWPAKNEPYDSNYLFEDDDQDTIEDPQIDEAKMQAKIIRKRNRLSRLMKEEEIFIMLYNQEKKQETKKFFLKRLKYIQKQINDAQKKLDEYTYFVGF